MRMRMRITNLNKSLILSLCCFFATFQASSAISVRNLTRSSEISADGPSEAQKPPQIQIQTHSKPDELLAVNKFTPSISTSSTSAGSFDYVQFALRQHEQLKKSMASAALSKIHESEKNLKNHNFEQINTDNANEPSPSPLTPDSDKTSTRLYYEDFQFKTPENHENYEQQDEPWYPHKPQSSAEFQHHQVNIPPPPSVVDHEDYFYSEQPQIQIPAGPEPHYKPQLVEKLPPLKDAYENLNYFNYIDDQDENVELGKDHYPIINLPTKSHYTEHLSILPPPIPQPLPVPSPITSSKSIYGPALGKALKLLIPSALFFTGVSALFPNRIFVPNNNNEQNTNNNNNLINNNNYGGVNNNINYRSKRSVPTSFSFDHPNFDQIPHEYGSLGLREFPPSPNIIPPTFPTFSSQQNVQKGQRKRRRTPGKRARHVENIFFSEPRYNFNDFGTLDMSHHDHNGGQILMQSSTLSLPQPQPSQSPSVTSNIAKDLGFDPMELPIDHTTSNQGYSNANLANLKVVKKIRRRKLNGTSSGSGTTTGIATRGIAMNNKLLKEEIKKEIVALSTQDPDGSANTETETKSYDLSPDSPVMGLITNYAMHDRDSPTCQKKALCELAIKGSKSNGTKFEKFLWGLASVVPDYVTSMYELDDIFKSIRKKTCAEYICNNPNLDIQL